MATEIIHCTTCGAEFEFTDGEREFYDQRQLTPPKRCRPCRAQKRAEFEARNSTGEK